MLLCIDTCIYNYIQCTVHTIGLHIDAFAGQVPVHNGRLLPILVAELGMEEREPISYGHCKHQHTRDVKDGRLKIFVERAAAMVLQDEMLCVAVRAGRYVVRGIETVDVRMAHVRKLLWWERSKEGGNEYM